MSKITESRASPLQEKIDSLVQRLDCEERPDCQVARQSLVDIGRPAVTSLIALVGSPKAWVRWESTKALGQIGDRSAIPALINTLEDKDPDVRWVAAEALIQMGNDATVPLLDALIRHPESFWIYEGAHHVLSHLARRDVKTTHHSLKHTTRHTGALDAVLEPVLVGLESTEPSVEVPPLAHKAIEELKS